MNVNKFKNLWRVYREEASADGDQAGGSGEATPPAAEETPPQGETPPADPPSEERPEWLLDKYIGEDKTLDDAIKDQAKSYKEIQSKLGSFTGAPDEYEISIPEEIEQAGFALDKESDMFKDAIEFAKSSNMNQEGFNKMIELWATNELAAANAHQAELQKAFESMDNAKGRIENINSWANKSLPPDLVGELDGLLTTPQSVKVVEQIIAMTRNAPVNPDNAEASTGPTAEEVKQMQFEKDANGNRRINTDPEFKARYIKLRDQVYGTEEHRQMVG